MSGNELNYVEYDYDDLMLQLINRVKLQDAWKDTYHSGTGQMLIELYAYVANLVLFYIERRAEETYIGTAQNLSSLVNIARLLGYQPQRMVSSSGTLTFTRAATYTKKIFIPSYTECQTASGVKFITTAYVDISASTGSSTVEVEAMQGYVANKQIVSAGGTLQQYNLEYTDIENSGMGALSDNPLDGVQIWVDNVAWTRVDSFTDSVNTSKHFILLNELDGTVTLIFGDNVFGLAPSTGSVIDIKMIRTAGLDGNVYEQDKITSINSTLYDTAGVDVTDLITVSNNSGDPTSPNLFLGGDEAESGEEIRTNAPKVFATGDRAVTRQDFITLLEAYAGVSNANVWGENEESPPDYDMYNQLKIVVILQDWYLPNDTFEEELSDFLYTKSLMTVRYSFVDADILLAVPSVLVTVLPGYSLSEVQNDVETAIGTYFVLGSTTSLGQNKRESDIVRLIEETEGVSYCHLTMWISKALTEYYDSFYDYGVTLTTAPIIPEYVRLYVNDTLIATDDGSGNFVDAISDYSVTSGEVNYTTGYVGATISPGLTSGDILYVRYQQNNGVNNGDIIVDKDQIVKLDDVVFTSVAYDTTLEA